MAVKWKVVKWKAKQRMARQQSLGTRRERRWSVSPLAASRVSMGRVAKS